MQRAVVTPRGATLHATRQLGKKIILLDNFIEQGSERT